MFETLAQSVLLQSLKLGKVDTWREVFVKVWVSDRLIPRADKLGNRTTAQHCQAIKSAFFSETPRAE